MHGVTGTGAEIPPAEREAPEREPAEREPAEQAAGQGRAPPEREPAEQAAGQGRAPPEQAAEPAADPAGECEDRLKRAMADLENMRRQSERDVAMRVASAVDRIMADVVNIRDDLARAREASTGADAAGLEGILRNADALLARNGVSEIEALGMPFDPLRHETVRVVEDPALEDGTVTSVIRKGYICRDRVLRPSLVAISRRIGEQDG